MLLVVCSPVLLFLAQCPEIVLSIGAARARHVLFPSPPRWRMVDSAAKEADASSVNFLYFIAVLTEFTWCDKPAYGQLVPSYCTEHTDAARLAAERVCTIGACACVRPARLATCLPASQHCSCSHARPLDWTGKQSGRSIGRVPWLWLLRRCIFPLVYYAAIAGLPLYISEPVWSLFDW